MRLLHLIIKIVTARTFRYPLKKYIWLMFLLLTAVAYINPTFAQAASNTQSNQNDKKEMITGFLGINLGEDMGPYISGRYADYSMYVPELGYIPGNLFTYILLKSPVDLTEAFPGLSQLKLMGIRDEHNRTIVILLKGYADADCEQASTPNTMRGLLRQKYKNTKPKQKQRNTDEEYGDSEGNSIRIDCNSRDFTITYTSHLKQEYIGRILAELKKQQEDIKSNLLKKGGI